jgi:hypothetical protein
MENSRANVNNSCLFINTQNNENNSALQDINILDNPQERHSANNEPSIKQHHFSFARYVPPLLV